MLEEAKEIALIGGNYLKDHFLTEINISIKGTKDLVTEIDYGCEQIVITEIERRFPEHSILSEEKGLIDKNSDYKWVLDPLDGTINFAKGIPLFGIILSLLYKEEVIIGVIYIPMLNELYHVEKGKGSYLNNTLIKVSQTNSLNDAILSLGDFNIGIDDVMKKATNKHLIDTISTLSPKSMRTKCFGAACVDLTFLASGRTDALFYAFSNPWDVLAGELLLSEAGGEIIDLGNHHKIYTNGKLKNEIMVVLNK